MDAGSVEPEPYPLGDAGARSSGSVAPANDDEAPSSTDEPGPSSTRAPVSADRPPDEPNEDDGETVVAMANGTSNGTAHGANGEVRPHVEPDAFLTTQALVRAFAAARAALVERRRALASELSTIEATLSEAPAEHGEEPPGSAPGDASPRRPGCAPVPGSKAQRVLGFVREHPGTTTGEIARALRREGGEISGALFELRRSGRAEAAGRRPHTTWTAADFSAHASAGTVD